MNSDLLSLLILLLLLLFFFSLQRPLQKSPQDSVVSIRIGMKFAFQVAYKYASINGVGFSILRRTFKMAATTSTSFQAEKCYNLVSEHEATARRLRSSLRTPVPDL